MAISLTEYIGEMGLYQWRVFAVLFVMKLFMVDSLHIIFIGADMPHWCRVPELEDLPYEVQKSVAIPARSTNPDGSYGYSSCEMFSLNYSAYNVTDFNSWNRSSMITKDVPVVQCAQWTYDQSQFVSTIVKKFASTAFMAGYLVSAATSGALSDRFGRKTIMLSCFLLKITGTLVSIFAGNFGLFAAARFVIGFGHVGFQLTTFVLVMELCGRNYRSLLGTSFQIAFSIAYMTQPAFAYLLRDEFWYQVAATAPHILYPFIIIYVIPESPRWLAVQGRYKDAAQLVEKICETNGMKLPPDFDPADLVSEVETLKSQNCSALLASPTMRLRTVIMDFTWFTCSLIYYAVAFNTGALHGNIYLNTFLSGALEIPAYLLSAVLMNWKRLGRRWTSSCSLIGAGVATFICIPLILYDRQTETTILSILGKSLVSISFAVIYVHSTEMFPTEVRNVGVGTASMCGRISSMVASFVGGPLSLIWQPLPSLVFGVLSTVSGLLYVILPETLGQIMPDTIQQAEQCGRRRHNRHPDDGISPSTELQENAPKSRLLYLQDVQVKIAASSSEGQQDVADA